MYSSSIDSVDKLHHYTYVAVIYLCTIPRADGQRGGVAMVSEVRWETDMHTPVARKLVNETHSRS